MEHDHLQIPQVTHAWIAQREEHQIQIRSQVQCSLGQHFVAGFLCFQVAKLLIQILPLLPISANLWNPDCGIGSSLYPSTEGWLWYWLGLFKNCGWETALVTWPVVLYGIKLKDQHWAAMQWRMKCLWCMKYQGVAIPFRWLICELHITHIWVHKSPPLSKTSDKKHPINHLGNEPPIHFNLRLTPKLYTRLMKAYFELYQETT